MTEPDKLRASTESDRSSSNFRNDVKMNTKRKFCKKTQSPLPLKRGVRNRPRYLLGGRAGESSYINNLKTLIHQIRNRLLNSHHKKMKELMMIKTLINVWKKSGK
jgi:hypothetical protein